MAQQIYKLTQAGLDKVKKELDHLVNEVRLDVIQELTEARAQGDLSENADYDAAREKQAQIEATITRYQNMIDHHEIIEPGNAEFVAEGVSVTYMDLSDNSVDEVKIVGSFEANPFIGKISNECTLAQALQGHKEGETVLVPVTVPYEVIITKIEIKEDQTPTVN